MILHSPSCHCIVSYGVAWYCIFGFGARAVSRKTPTYFMIIINELYTIACILLEGQIVINFKWSILTDLLLLVRGTNIHQLESHSSRIIFWHYNGFLL